MLPCSTVSCLPRVLRCADLLHGGNRGSPYILLNHILHSVGHPKKSPGQIGVAFRMPGIIIAFFLSLFNLMTVDQCLEELFQVQLFCPTFLCLFPGKLWVGFLSAKSWKEWCSSNSWCHAIVTSPLPVIARNPICFSLLWRSSTLSFVPSDSRAFLPPN